MIAPLLLAVSIFLPFLSRPTNTFTLPEAEEIVIRTVPLDAVVAAHDCFVDSSSTDTVQRLKSCIFLVDIIGKEEKKVVVEQNFLVWRIPEDETNPGMTIIALPTVIGTPPKP